MVWSAITSGKGNREDIPSIFARSRFNRKYSSFSWAEDETANANNIANTNANTTANANPNANSGEVNKHQLYFLHRFWYIDNTNKGRYDIEVSRMSLRYDHTAQANNSAIQ